MSWRASPLHRWSSSTAPWPSPWPTGPSAGLELADRLQADGTLRSYHLLPSVRGDLLSKLGRYEEARAEFERAAQLTQNARESRLLRDRAAACTNQETSNVVHAADS